ncbi:MAG: Maf family protein [Candidatus Ancaeobacter aquaticus]|nr:Maf family protein [Candidatus Ancaeobacter aquaticus]
MKKIILASSSPRRKKLLKQLGIPFEIVHSDYVEDMTIRKPRKELAQYLALEKGMAVARKYKNAIIISADTFVCLGKKIIGKPRDGKEAIAHLKALSGRFHTVVSGIAVIDMQAEKHYIATEETRVKIKTLSEKEIKAYVATKEPLDKAGAYAIQGLGGALVEEVDGDYFNVIGLPLSKLSILLKKVGIHIY